MNLISNLRSQFNKKLDQKVDHLSKFGKSGSGQGGFSLASLGLGSILGGSSGNTPTSDSSDLSLDDFGSDLEPGVSVSDGTE